MNKVTYPLKLSYITKSPIWSGDALIKDWGFESPEGKIGEVWSLSVRPNEMCCVTNGEYAGEALVDVLGCSDFPLLVKLIDAGDKLSVQVHPDDGYLSSHKTAETHGKTEMWVILSAQPGAKIIYGLEDGVTPTDFAQAVENNRILPALKRVDAKPGDVFFIPAGLVHAIGKGILLAEVQQNCDLTYRVYDYDRVGKDGKPRELHKAQAIEVARSFTEEEINAVRYGSETEYVPLGFEKVIANCSFFRVGEYVIDGRETLPAVKGGEVLHLLCLEGQGNVGEFSAKKGESFIITADCGCVKLLGSVKFLASTAYVG